MIHKRRKVGGSDSNRVIFLERWDVLLSGVSVTARSAKRRQRILMLRLICLLRAGELSELPR